MHTAAPHPLDKPGVSRAVLMHPGHPLMLSMSHMLLEQHANLLRQGAILVDQADDGTEPWLLFPTPSLCPWRGRASGVLLHGTGTGTADELTCVNNHRPSIFLASPSRDTWLLAVQNGWPVAGFNDTSK